MNIKSSNNTLLTYLLVALISTLSSSLLFAETEELIIKTAFIEHFVRFVEWPDSIDVKNEFIIGFIGENALINEIKKLYNEKKINFDNMNIKFKEFTDFKNLDYCNVLIISSDQKKDLDRIISYTQDKPILTISDENGFSQKGVLINFYLLDGKVRFEVNEGAVRKSNLHMSYLLYNAAKIVNKWTGE